MKLAILFFAFSAQAQIINPPAPQLKEASNSNLLVCAKSLETVFKSNGELSPCGYVMDAGVMGQSGAFVYTAPDQFFFFEATEGKYWATLPSGAKEDGEHKIYFEVKKKQGASYTEIANVSCDKAPENAADYTEVKDKPRGYVQYIHYRGAFRDVLAGRIARVQETYERQKLEVENRIKGGSREGPLKVDRYRDALMGCSDIRPYSISASAQLNQMPQKQPIPARVNTINRVPVKAKGKGKF